MNSHRLAAVALGLLLAGAAPGLLAAEFGDEPAFEPLGGSESVEPKKIVVPPRAELDRMIFGMGQKVATFYEARTKLRQYLDAEDNSVVLEALKDALPKANKLQRFHIVRILGDWGKPEGLALIMPYVADKSDDSVQRAAMSGVTRSKSADPAVLSAIRPLITDNRDDNVQKEAILSVGRMKDYESVPTLIEMLRGEDQGLRTNVLWALKEITGKDFGYDADAWQSWWDFYKREVQAKKKPRAEERMATGAAPRTATTASTAAEQKAAAGNFQLWMAGILGVILLALPVAWGVCRWWLRATMNRLLRVDPAGARDPAVVALRFAASDRMPDWIVYPFLAKCVENGSAQEVSVALNVLMFRLHGGCAETAVSGGRLASSSPVPGARERIAMFPRGLMADMALAGYQSGRCLLRIAEPDNPVWKRDPTPKEKVVAERHLSSLLKRGR